MPGADGVALGRRHSLRDERSLATNRRRPDPGRRRRVSRGTFVLVVAWLAVAASVAAHEGVPRLIPEPEQVNPGGVLTVRWSGPFTGRARSSSPSPSAGLGPRHRADRRRRARAGVPRGPGRSAARHLPLEADAFGIDVPRTSSCPVRRSRGGQPGEKDEDDGLLVALLPPWLAAVAVRPGRDGTTADRDAPCRPALRPAFEAFAAVVALSIAGGAVAYVLVSRSRRSAPRVSWLLSDSGWPPDPLREGLRCPVSPNRY